jgi:amidohydrolase
MAHDAIETWLAEHAAEIIQWRRDIHAHPELGFDEFATTDYVSARLEAAGLAPVLLPTGTGLTVDLGPQDGKRIALRADLDALPLQETTGAPYASQVDGVAHACGHDAHTAVLLGTALALASMDELPVGVRLIFQPAEEIIPGGAQRAIAAGALDGVSKIFALHCEPRIEVGRVGVRAGAITSAADTVELTLGSPGGHTARPHLTTDLVYAMGAVVTGLPGMLSRRIDPRTGTVMVWGAVNAGRAPNAIPQTGWMSGTVRTGDRASWDLLEPLVREIVHGLLAPTGVSYTLDYHRGVPPVVNDVECAAALSDAATEIGAGVLTTTPQSGGGEDFSWYLEHVPGAMGRLGVWPGDGHPQRDIHQPDFDLDERALATGIRLFTNVVLAG